MTCPRCAAVVKPEDRFCGHCGERIIRLEYPDPIDTSPQTPKRMNTTEIKFKLGLVYFKKGKTDEAIHMWRQVLSNDPKHQGAQRMLREAETQL